MGFTAGVYEQLQKLIDVEFSVPRRIYYRGDLVQIYDISCTLGDREAGDASIWYLPQRETVHWQTFFPTEKLTQNYKGFGSGYHVKILLGIRDHEELCTTRRIAHTTHVEEARREQLHRMGLSPQREYDFEKYVEKSITYANRLGYNFNL